MRDIAVRLLDPSSIQLFIVGDKTIPVRTKDGTELTLEEDLKALAKNLGLQYREIKLR
jgi:hypothetical protein